MKIKTEDRIIDSEEELIMLILDDEEKMLISTMGNQTKFCIFPTGKYSEEYIKHFMKG